MGRRKIEIKAIKDDRNRSVTFLKRKGGLFKKAHELSVLCSVDVVVIIFGSNKKLYEYSSGDIGEILTRYQYYRGANEHQGPADFTGKGRNMDDDDDHDNEDDDELGISDHESVEPQRMPPQFQNRIARQNGPAYIHNPGISTLHNELNMSPHPHGLSQHRQGPPIQSPPQAGIGQTPHYLLYGPEKQNHQQLVQIGADEYQRPSMPPTFPSARETSFPTLNVQIPGFPSDSCSKTAESNSSPQSTSNAAMQTWSRSRI